MASIEVNKVAIGSILAPLLSYQFLLPMAQLRAGLAYAGPRARLRRFARDMLLGWKPMKIGAIGGSVTCGQGASNSTDKGWFSVVAKWLVDGFPAVNVTARNGAVAAATLSYMATCPELSVDPDVDLVFVESNADSGFHDKVFDNEVVRLMERLLRRLMELPGRPAVVLLQVPSPRFTREAPERPFYETMEDLEGSLAQYYDVQYLSLRTALYRLAALDHAEGFRWEQLFANQYPGDAGHRVMADLVAYLLQETALDLLLEPFSGEDERRARQPLPQPMYTGNLPLASPSCLVGDALHAAATAVSGFQFLNDSSQGPRSRWGYVATTPGASLTVRLDTRRPETYGNGPVAVFVRHIKSYEHMGVASLSCASPCTCGTVEVDAHITDRMSQVFQARLDVSQLEACEVTLKVLGRTSSGEHTFKVLGVVVAESPDSAGVLERLAGPGGYLPEAVQPLDHIVAGTGWRQ